METKIKNKNQDGFKRLGLLLSIEACQQIEIEMLEDKRTIGKQCEVLIDEALSLRDLARKTKIPVPILLNEFKAFLAER